MEKFDRARQLQLLERIRDAFPDRCNLMEQTTGIPTREIAADLYYLAGHGLVEVVARQMDGDPRAILSATITSKGIDFLADDGGLGAILGVVTVKLHQETIRDLLIERVRESDAEESVKGKLVDQLKALPAEALSRLAEKALDKALYQMPGAVQWLQTVLWS